MVSVLAASTVDRG